MKRLLSSLVLILIPSLSVFLVPQKYAIAAEVVGNEKQEVCWQGIAPADEFQVYFDQTDPIGKKNLQNTVPALSSNSRCMLLSSLKACTSYNWNLKARSDVKWRWVWTSDKQFMTGGRCPTASTGTQITTSTGTKAVVVGTAKATANWTPTDGASKYNVYFKVCGQIKYTGAVSVSDKGQSVEISYLNPNVRYCYQAVPVVNSKEVWNKNPEKVLREPTVSQPVLGTSTSQDMPRFSDQGRVYYRNPALNQQPEDVTGYRYNNPGNPTAYSYTNQNSVGVPNRYTDNVLGASTTGNATTSRVASWLTNVHSSDMKKIHVYFWSSQADKHAVRNLPGNARQVTINYLNTNRTYHYSVQAIMNDDTAKMLVNDKVL